MQSVFYGWMLSTMITVLALRIHWYSETEVIVISSPFGTATTWVESRDGRIAVPSCSASFSTKAVLAIATATTLVLTMAVCRSSRVSHDTCRACGKRFKQDTGCATCTNTLTLSRTHETEQSPWLYDRIR